MSLSLCWLVNEFGGIRVGCCITGLVFLLVGISVGWCFSWVLNQLGWYISWLVYQWVGASVGLVHQLGWYISGVGISVCW